jgi:hypothetical protein
MPVWVQLRSMQQLEIGGKTERFFPGDWVEVGKQTAMQWVAAGHAWLPLDRLTDDREAIGVVTVGYGMSKAESGRLKPIQVVECEQPTLAFTKTLLLEQPAYFRSELIPVGFKLLDTWEIAIPLLSYDTLAAQLSTPADRRKTEAVIRDLRVPVYNYRAMYVRDCEATQKLLSAWAEERTGGNDYLALLRAIYKVKPILCALPPNWLEAA